MRTIVLAALSLATVAACQPRLEQTWQLTNFRVLTVKADPPEPARGTDTTVTLGYADTMTRPVQVFWLACAVSITGGFTGGGAGSDAGSPTQVPGCALVTMPGSPAPDFRTTVTVQIPETGGARDGSNHEVITLFGFACAGGTIGIPASGSTEPTCRGSNAYGWSFTRTVRIHDPASADPPNANPHIRDVLFGMEGATMPLTDSAPPTIPLCTDQTSESQCPTYVIQVAYDDGSRETFHATDPNDAGIVMRTERITTGYVISGGELGGAFRTDTAENPTSNMQVSFRAPNTAGDLHLYVYAADGRGGFDQTDRHIRVQ